MAETSILINTSLEGLCEALLPKIRDIVNDAVQANQSSKRDVYVKTVEELCAALTDGSDRPYTRATVYKILSDPKISKGCVGETNEGVQIYNVTKIQQNLIKNGDKRRFGSRV